MTATAACLFCAIVAGREPSVMLHHDPVCTVILDIHPVSEGHALILPNRHAALATDLSPDEFRHLTGVWHGLLAACRAAGVAQAGANLLLNDGAAANRHVPHLHLHLIPRRRGDSARALAMFALRTVNRFGRRHSGASLQAFAARVAPQIERSMNRGV